MFPLLSSVFHSAFFSNSYYSGCFLPLLESSRGEITGDQGEMKEEKDSEQDIAGPVPQELSRQ